MDKKPTLTTTDFIPVSKLTERRAFLVEAREKTMLQLNGLDNQIYIIDQFLHPDPDPASEAPQDTPDGTI